MSGTRADWEWALRELGLPADASTLEIIAALRASEVIAPKGAVPTAAGQKPRAYLDAAQLAAEHGLDLSKIRATGAAGRICRGDVERNLPHAVPDDVYRGRLAAELGVELDAVYGSGAGGAVTVQDIVGHSRAAAAVAAATGARQAAAAPGGYFGGANPFFERMARAQPALYNVVSGEGPLPQMFSEGPLPSVIASGQDPAVLKRLPPGVRHAAAEADGTQLYGLIQQYAGAGADPEASVASHGLQDYEDRCRARAAGQGLSRMARDRISQADADAQAEEFYRSLFPPDTRPGG